MKKLFLVMCASLAMMACEQDEFAEMVNLPAEIPLQTKTATTLSDFDPVKELIGLPLNVVHAKNSTYKYLSCEKSGNRVNLATKDDGTGCQRWYLRDFGPLYKYPFLVLQKGNSLCDKGLPVVISADDPNLNERNYPHIYPNVPNYPILKVADPLPLPGSGFGNFFRFNEKSLYISWGQMLSNAYVAKMSNLQALADSPDLSYCPWDEVLNSNENCEWIIVPVGDYKVVDVKYEKVASSGDYIIPKSVYCGGVVIGDLPGSVTRTVSVSKTFESTSKFTETSGVSTQYQSSFGWSLGANVSMVHIGINGDINNSMANEQLVSYETTDRNTTTIEESYTLEFAPHSPCRVEIFKMTYNASLTYILTLEKVGGESSGKRFRIKGKWDGIVLSDLYFNSYSIEGDATLDSGVIQEGTHVIQIGY